MSRMTSPATPTPSPSLTPRPPLRPRTVLLVDDHALLRRRVAWMLRRAGWRVIEAGGGEEALRVAFGEPLDVLFTDVHMPGMEGPQLALRLRQLRPGLPVVYTSGDPIVSAAALPAASAFLPKPSTPAQMIEALERAVTAR